MSNKSSVTEPLMVQASAMVLRVREHLYAGLSQLLKPYGLTEPQFNVLRILRGAGTEGLPSLEVGRRMITRIPDVTRLLDRSGITKAARNGAKNLASDMAST